VAKLLAGVDAADPPLGNIRLYPDDARALLAALPDASVGRVFVLFPDPWPKSRHHRRRFIAPPQLDLLARVMRPGAELRLATDHIDYLRWMLLCLLDHPAFRWCARGPADWRGRPADWPPTRYEEKALEKGLVPAYLRFERRGPEEPAKR
jgi:tRNA (guanine-N7-)-methyltransferase